MTGPNKRVDRVTSPDIPYNTAAPRETRSKNPSASTAIEGISAEIEGKPGENGRNGPNKDLICSEGGGMLADDHIEELVVHRNDMHPQKQDRRTTKGNITKVQMLGGGLERTGAGGQRRNLQGDI